MPDSFMGGTQTTCQVAAEWLDAEIPEGRLLIGPTRGIPQSMRRYSLGVAGVPVWQDPRVTRYLNGLDALGRQRLRRIVDGVDFRVTDSQLLARALRALGVGSLSAFLIPRAIPSVSAPDLHPPPRPGQANEDPPGEPAQWSVTDRVAATLRRSIPYLPRDMQQAAKGLFSLETVYWLAGFLVVWAGGHLAGYGEAIDVVLLAIGYAMVGWSVFEGLNDLGHGIAMATTAKTGHDLDLAAKRTASGLTILTINAILALVTKMKPSSGGRKPMVAEEPQPTVSSFDSLGARAEPVTPEPKPLPEPEVGPPPKAQVPDPDRRAYLNEKFGRTGDLNQDINIRGRQETATNFFKAQGVPKENISSYMTGIDFTKPVDVQTLNSGKTLYQYQAPGAPQGNWYSMNPSVQPTELGISPLGFNRATQTIEPKILNTYTTTQAVPVLRSTSAAVDDFWSVKGQSFPTEGGATQLFSTQKSAFGSTPQ
ncbi:polymorphic toxin type 46 domain-containing protein [Azospirillum sp. B4]|uniref:polymorphic toxin type 46 domain-containing protein n=1 Tax=Azospirillum sp. B4 TaxID=95605 RepID=UPI0019018CCA|nr:polymorphic toxin type 46 domain-containing protein [Azospirillum sp. B4]